MDTFTGTLFPFLPTIENHKQVQICYEVCWSDDDNCEVDPYILHAGGTEIQSGPDVGGRKKTGMHRW
jgi:hypothetical protein